MQARTQQLVEVIKTMPFFESLGSCSDNAVTGVHTWKQAILANRSAHWRWLKMEAQNRLTKHLYHGHRDRYHLHWNRVVEEIKPEIEPVVQRLAD